MENFEKKAKAYALKNALAHEGKAMQGAVISSLFNEGLEKEEMGKYGKKISEIVAEINKLSLEKQKKEFEKIKDLVSERETREGLPELPDVPKTGVIMRFRPAPSGSLHIGNMIGAGVPNSIYVKKYDGKFYVIIDDTDPERTLVESYKNVKRDCDWMLGNVSKYLNSSDRMNIYYSYAEQLIQKKSAYVCICSQEEFKKLSENKKECPCRNISVAENMKRWNKMIDKKGFDEGEAVLRFKTPMSIGGISHKNPAMRDFPLARISLSPHPIQGNKFRVWPLMNLVVAVDDMELGVTHIIRGKDHRDNAERQKMIFEVFGKKFPWTFFIGRIKFTDIVLSKRKLTEGIKSGEFSGEDDERLSTIAALRKRGFDPKSLEEFVIQRGLTEVDKVMDSKEFYKTLESFSKK